MPGEFKIIHADLSDGTGAEAGEDTSIAALLRDYSPAVHLLELKTGNYEIELDFDRSGYQLYAEFKKVLQMLDQPDWEPGAYRNAIPFDANRNRLHSFLLSGFMHDVPALFFVKEQDTVLIYTRTVDEKDLSRAIVFPGRDSVSPVTLSTEELKSEIGRFLVRFFTAVEKNTGKIETVPGYKEEAEFINSISTTPGN